MDSSHIEDVVASLVRDYLQRKVVLLTFFPYHTQKPFLSPIGIYFQILDY